MIEIKVLHEGDVDLLLNAADGVFDNPVNEALAKEFLEDDRHHIAVAVRDGVVVAFASGVHYVHPDKPPELWINEVSVAPTHRGHGLGKAVLRAILDVGREHFCANAWVLTYRNNSAAIALYSSIGGVEGADDSGPTDAMIGYTFKLG